jgi:hypothetical protein
LQGVWFDAFRTSGLTHTSVNCVRLPGKHIGKKTRQIKSSRGKGIFPASSGLLLTFLFHIGNQKCCKIIVI